MADGDADGRVLIAFADGPLTAPPTWTRVDTLFQVATVEITAGKQDEFDETETNHATVVMYDQSGELDQNNLTGTYYGDFNGKQILLQVYNPVDDSWYERFRGVIDSWDYQLDPSTEAGVSVNATVTIEAVGVFDYLAGFELTAGLHGDAAPAGYEDIVFYEDGEVDDRIIAVLTDAGVASTRRVVFSGNVLVQEQRRDSGDSALVALRDLADAEAPGLSNIYEDRHGRFVFHGRQAPFDPVGVSAGASAGAWDYNAFKIGDGAAITGDPTYAQMRPPFNYRVARNRLVNVALIIPRGVDRTTIPTLVESDATSITAYGTHPYNYPDNLNNGHKTNGDTAAEDCNRNAQYLVANYKDPTERIEDLTVKAIAPTDARADATWEVLSKADIADGVTLTVGYPGGSGIDADFFIVGWSQTITPLNGDHDMVELSLSIAPQPVNNPYND